jgi:hypothetical protein
MAAGRADAGNSSTDELAIRAGPLGGTEPCFGLLEVELAVFPLTVRDPPPSRKPKTFDIIDGQHRTETVGELSDEKWEDFSPEFIKDVFLHNTVHKRHTVPHSGQ